MCVCVCVCVCISIDLTLSHSLLLHSLTHPLFSLLHPRCTKPNKHIARCRLDPIRKRAVERVALDMAAVRGAGARGGSTGRGSGGGSDAVSGASRLATGGYEFRRKGEGKQGFEAWRFESSDPWMSYASQVEAARQLGIKSTGNISYCVNGKQRQAGGYEFR